MDMRTSGSEASEVGLTAHVLRVECQTTAPLALPFFTGSALRGALLGALRGQFCPAPAADCAPCPFAGACPIARLIATGDPAAGRGDEAPRPYVLRPVDVRARTLATGDPFSFGLTLIGDAAAAFPYLLQGLLAMGEAGFGLRERAPGTFQVDRVLGLNPYIAAEQAVYQRGRSTVYAPTLAITQSQISAAAAMWPADRLTLELRSPLRLVQNGQLVHEPSMAAVMRRLLRRLTDLSALFSPSPLQADFPMLLRFADAVQTTENRSEWLDLESRSSRSGRRTPIGGLVGRVSFEGDLAPLLPYLGWLPVVGLGKDVTKGNGWIELA